MTSPRPSGHKRSRVKIPVESPYPHDSIDDKYSPQDPLGCMIEGIALIFVLVIVGLVFTYIYQSVEYFHE